MDSAYFSGRSGGEKNCFPKFFFKNQYPLCGPVAAKPLVLELLFLEVGTSVASALTAETVLEIITGRQLRSGCLSVRPSVRPFVTRWH